ncbi:MAG: DUF2157 domain-containing protein [Candidatus Hydrogenedentes bacterium]|nr:DUF2157 domain-containing protein [Candidatus Hydrogenedentota bacterium]
MKRKHILWLYEELPNLVSAGVLSAEGAARLRQYYGDAGEQVRRNYALAVCAALGAALIGLGIILLFAHNWENLSRPARTVLSFTPLVLGQLIAGWTLLRRPDSVPWREGSGIFLMAGVGAAIALIGQTYHISGDLGAFLFTWMLLSLPIVYVLGAVVPGAFYWIGLTWWAGFVQSEGGQVVLFWPLAALMGPYLWKVARDNPYGPRAILLGWVLALCLCVATGITLERSLPGLWTVIYCALFATMYLLGAYAFGGAPAFWQRPLEVVGAAGIAVVSLMLTFREPWREVGWNYYRSSAGYHAWAAVQDYLLASGLLAASALLLVLVYRERRLEKIPFGVAGVVALVVYATIAAELPESFALAIFNVYLFALGLITLFSGLLSRHLPTLNWGLLLVSTLIIARFFDVDLSFTARGIAFILVGIGFLAANLVVRRTGDTS